jgi:predicted RNase H-related nuclease YkuK (DUF458 family)
MNFDCVVGNIEELIQNNPDDVFRLAVGTDSQVRGGRTCFVSAIHLHRVGYGAWGCITKKVYNRKFSSLREKIAKETIMTYDLVLRLNEELFEKICEISLQNELFNIDIEAHIDVGENGETRRLIREMTGYFQGTGIRALIKPYSYAASSYADRLSKTV